MTPTCELGEKYHDRITGFEGTATQRLERLDSTPLVYLEKETLSRDGAPVGEWFDEPRLKTVDF